MNKFNIGCRKRMNFTIRAAVESDFEQIVNLFKEFAAFEKVPERMLNSVERMNIEKDLFHCFVAETTDKIIVGYVTYFFGYFTWCGKALYMDDLYVKPEYRGQKIGSTLIRHVFSYAKESHCHKVRWQVSKWNDPAIAFYKSLGAVLESTEANCDLLLDCVNLS